MLATDDTIAAIATPPGEGGIGIVRLSGPCALDVASRLFRPSRPRAVLSSHRMVHGTLHIPDSNEILDEALVCFMREPRSFTGEDVVEIHCHGSPVVLRGVLAGCILSGARLAERGEFTLRAYLNGRLDLAQAEAVVDIVRARTPTAAQVAAQGLTGALGKRLHPIAESLTGTLAYLEATIDFVEEGLPEQAGSRLADEVEVARRALDDLSKRAAHGAILRDGVQVVLTGKPNVGKSSILNTLLRRDRAIVTPIPGTTRDTLEELADIHGIPMSLVDTAGLVESDDIVEQMGVQRSYAAVRASAICVLVLDSSQELDAKDVDAARALRQLSPDTPFIALMNKSDLPDLMGDQYQALFDSAWRPTRVLRCSALHEESMRAVEDELADLALGGTALRAEDTLIENTRQAEALRDAICALQTVVDGLNTCKLPELICIDLRSALECLGGATGSDVSEAVLSRIFSDFCIGK